MQEIHNIITIDGIRMELQPLDLDHDGKTGGIEKVSMKFQQDFMPVIQPTELGDVLKHINKDDVDLATGMSDIDLNSRLHYAELPPVLAIDTLVRLRCLTAYWRDFTRQKKRLAVSLAGEGRKEIVDITGRKRDSDERKATGGFGDRIKGFLGLGGGEQK